MYIISKIFKKFKNNSYGFSLLELIVIISIVVVLVGGVSIGFSLVSNKSATQCAENIRISLDKTRINTMGKLSGCVGFFKTSQGVYMVQKFDYGKDLPSFDASDPSAVKIGKSDVNVSYGTAGTEYALTDTGYIVEFDRSDGSLKSKSTIKFQVQKRNRIYLIEVDGLTGRVTLK